MKKKTFKLVSATSSTLTHHTFETATPTEKIVLDKAFPTPPSEETIARLNALAQEYPFCAYIKQSNLAIL